MLPITGCIWRKWQLTHRCIPYRLICLTVTLTFLLAAGAHGAAYPQVFTDYMGNRITLSHAPQRIISAAPSLTEILFALGLGDRVVAVDTDSDYPAAATRKERIGSGLAPSFERIAALQPDLVLLWDASAQAVQQKLTRLGITAAVFSPQSFADVYACITTLGRLTGTESTAAAVVESMRKKVTLVTSTVSKARTRPVVLYEVWPNPLYTAGPGSLAHEMIELAGGRNLAADAKSPWPMYNLETAIAHNPEVILTPFDKEQSVVSLNKALWAQVSAVRNGRVCKVDQNLISRPGPRLADGLLAVAKAIHPELF